MYLVPREKVPVVKKHLFRIQSNPNTQVRTSTYGGKQMKGRSISDWQNFCLCFMLNSWLNTTSQACTLGWIHSRCGDPIPVRLPTVKRLKYRDLFIIFFFFCLQSKGTQAEGLAGRHPRPAAVKHLRQWRHRRPHRKIPSNRRSTGYDSCDIKETRNTL